MESVTKLTADQLQTPILNGQSLPEVDFHPYERLFGLFHDHLCQCELELFRFGYQRRTDFTLCGQNQFLVGPKPGKIIPQKTEFKVRNVGYMVIHKELGKSAKVLYLEK